MSCAFAAATPTTSTTTSTCNSTKITFSLHSNSIRHLLNVPTSCVFKKKHAMRIPKRSFASCFSLLSPFQLNFSLFNSFLDYPPKFTHFAARITPICACGEGLFVFFFF